MLDGMSGISDDTSNIMINLIEVILVSTFLYFILNVYRSRNNDELTILPFITAENNKQIDGRIISNTLISEISNIKSILQFNFAPISCKLLYMSNITPTGAHQYINTGENIEGVRFYLPNMISNKEHFEIDTDIGSSTFDEVTLPVVVIQYLKRSLFKKSNGCVSGSLDKNDSGYRIISLLQCDKCYCRDLSCKLNEGKEDCIKLNGLIRDLAFNISYDLINRNYVNKPIVETVKGLEYYTNSIYYYQKYMMDVNSEDLKLACKNCKQCFNVEKSDFLFYLLHNLGILSLNESDFLEAGELFYYANRIKPENSGSLLGIAASLFYRGKYEKSNEYLEKALEISDKKLNEDPKNINEMYMNSAINWNLGEYQKTLDVYSRLIRSNQKDASLWSLKACAHSMLLNQNDDALKAHDKALALEKNNAVIWARKSVFLDNQGNYDEALKICDKALELDSNCPDAWSSRGSILSHKGKNKEAINACDKAIKLVPNSIPAWSIKGLVLGKMSRYDEALEAHNKAKEMNPKRFYVWYNRAHTYLLMGEEELSFQDLAQAVEFNPSSISYLKTDRDFEGLLNKSLLSRLEKEMIKKDNSESNIIHISG